MDKALKKELKNILTGRVLVGEDGVVEALSSNRQMIFHGVPVGWASVRFWGIRRREQMLQIAQSGESAFEAVLAAMSHLGRLVELKQDPEALACIRRYVLNKPVVLAANYEGDGIVRITVYTGRGLFSWLACRRGLRDFNHALPVNVAKEVEISPSKKKRVEKEKYQGSKGKDEKVSRKEPIPEKPNVQKSPAPAKPKNEPKRSESKGKNTKKAKHGKREQSRKGKKKGKRQL